MTERKLVAQKDSMLAPLKVASKAEQKVFQMD